MQQERSASSHVTIHNGRPCLSKKIAVFLISTLIFISVFSMKTQAQNLTTPYNREVSDIEISGLSRQLNAIKDRIIPIDNELKSLEESHMKVTNEVTQLKEQMRKPQGFFGKITGVFGFNERKLKNLMAESQSMSDRITELQKMREPLVKDFVRIANRLIEKSEARIIILMNVLLKNGPGVDKASDQISAILQLARQVAEIRDTYTSASSNQVRTAPFLLSLGNDPEKLRLGALFSKNMAVEYRAEAERKKGEVRDLQASQRRNEKMIDQWKEIQRSNEEKESSGVESGTAGITLGFNESEARKKINKIKKDIERLLNEISNLEDEARKLDNQSKILEQRASQIEAKGK